MQLSPVSSSTAHRAVLAHPAPPPPRVSICQADAVVLGGSAAFRTDGSLQLGVRKLISNLQGLTYESDWLPSTAPMGAQHGEQAARAVPIWLW